MILIRTIMSSMLRLDEAYETIPFLVPHTKKTIIRSMLLYSRSGY